MEVLFKSIAVSLLIIFIGLIIDRQAKEFQILLSLVICIVISIVIMRFIQPIFVFLQELKELGDLNGDILSILLKSVAIALITEISALICSDSGNGSVSKILQMLGTVIILWLSIPIFEKILNLIQKLLGEL